jgi:predicted deacylase
MRALTMLKEPAKKTRSIIDPVIAKSSYWIRAQSSGILRPVSALGARIGKESLLGVISDPFGEQETRVTAPYSGIVIGRTNLPLVNEGDGLFHIARFHEINDAVAKIEEFHESHAPALLEPGDPDGPVY